MRAISAFFHLMRDTITYESLIARDGYGDETYAAPVSYRARVVGEQKAIVSFTGVEVISQQTVYVGAKIVAQPTDRITLSTALVNSTDQSAVHPPILGAKRLPDQSGTHHSVLYLG